MSSLRTGPALLSLLALVGVAACTSDASDDSPELSEEDIRIRPTDTEVLTRLKVTTPSGWTLPVNPADDARVTYRGASVPLNVQQRLTEGEGDLYVTSKFDAPLHAGKVTLAKGTATTYELGSLQPTYDPSTTLARDFGPTPALRVFFAAPNGAEGQVYGQVNSHPQFWNGKPQRALLAPPGAYRFSWSLPILDDVRKTLAGGESAAVPLTPPERRATILVKKPAARELPDAPAASRCHLGTRTFVVHRSSDNSRGQYGEPPSYDQQNTPALGSEPLREGRNRYGSDYEAIVSWAALPMAADTAIKVFPFAASEGDNHYELVVNNVAMPLSLQPGDTKTIQLERIDVDHVAVTKETGETYFATGRWKLYRQGPNNTWSPIAQREDCSHGGAHAIAFPTNTGVDVLPGTYRVVISYETEEGPKEQEHTVTVP